MLAWRNLKSFRQDAKFSTWLYRIATNCWLMHARKRKEELLGDRDDAIADEDDDDMPHLDRNHRRPRALLVAQDRPRARDGVLSEPERAAIVQCYHNDLSHEEAAYVLGIPVGTVKTHVLRAKQKLKPAMAAWDAGERTEASA